MITALLLGISYGFTAGISPGPLLGLVISQTLQRGWRAGSMVALAPLLSDLPIVLLTMLVLSHLPGAVLSWLGIIGGLFVVYLGGDTIHTAWKTGSSKSKNQESEIAEIAPMREIQEEKSSRTLVRAATTNAINPHPYLFWTTVGSQLLIRTAQTSGIASVIIFLISFYLLLVGSKLAIVLIVSRSRHWLKGRVYQGILIGSGVLLIGLGLLLIWEGYSSL
jgi:threonine/homoserine/homoserine lactone efflux protein